MISTLHILGNSRALDTYPSIYNALHLLGQAGIACDAAFACACDEHERLIRKRIPYGGTWCDRIQQLARISQPYDIVFIYEPEDLLIFQAAPDKPRHRALVHHSLEIPDFHSRPWFCQMEALASQLPDPLTNMAGRLLSRANLLLKERHVYALTRLLLYLSALARTDCLLIQDQLRLDLLSQFRDPKLFSACVLVPNAYLRELEPGCQPLPWVDEIKRDGSRLATYIGGIEDWALSDRLIDAVAACHEVKFLFSGWSRYGYAEYLQDYIRRRGYGNIFLHTGKLTSAQLNYLVEHSDMGLALYDARSRNVACTGLSSGKYHKFLSHGKPVVVSDLPCLAEFTTSNKFGTACSPDPESVKNAVMAIIRDYPAFSDRLAERHEALCSYERPYREAISHFHQLATREFKA